MEQVFPKEKHSRWETLPHGAREGLGSACRLSEPGVSVFMPTRVDVSKDVHGVPPLRPCPSGKASSGFVPHPLYSQNIISGPAHPTPATTSTGRGLPFIVQGQTADEERGAGRLTRVGFLSHCSQSLGPEPDASPSPEKREMQIFGSHPRPPKPETPCVRSNHLCFPSSPAVSDAP